MCCTRLGGLTYKQVHEDFTKEFRKSTLSRIAAKKLINKFQRTATSVKYIASSGRPRIKPDVVQRAQEVATSSSKSSASLLFHILLFGKVLVLSNPNCTGLRLAALKS